MTSSILQYISENRQIKSPAKIFTFLCDPPIGFYQVYIYFGAGQWTDRNLEFIRWTNKKQICPPSNLAANSNNITTPICFHLNRLENSKNDSLSEAHLQSSKTSRDSYLDLSIFSDYLKSTSRDPVPLRICFCLFQRHHPLHGSHGAVEEHWSSPRLREEVSGQDGVQEAHQDEHAHR